MRPAQFMGLVLIEVFRRLLAHNGQPFLVFPLSERSMLRTLFVLLLLCAAPPQAHAQSLASSLPRAPLSIAPAVPSASALSPRDVALAVALPPAPSPDAASRVHQNRARRILALGVGLALSAAITPTYVLPNREPCWGSTHEKGRAPLVAAAVVGSIGVALGVGGGTWLGLEARKHGYYASKRERLIAMGIGALGLAIGQSVQGTLFFLDQICSS
jgi:hypothetical protein